MAAAHEAMTPRAAAEEIARIQGLDAALERRASGITWMIWGIVTPAIFVTYNFLGLLIEVGVPERSLGPWFGVAWAPWTVMGVAATIVVWKSAGLVVPRLDNPRDGMRAMLFFFGFFFLGFWAFQLANVPLVEPAVMLAIVGLASVTLGLTRVLCTDRTERLLLLCGGLLALAATGIGALAAGGDVDAAYTIFSILGPVVSAVAWFGTGLYIAVRG